MQLSYTLKIKVSSSLVSTSTANGHTGTITCTTERGRSLEMAKY